ncbi:MAG: patatin-like phospholipase family protein [Candidatus Doudnabacteria bacterium]|nr:patatin-like phospholipase family protein [Candidatus Doudnabacteria bacterium]
MPDFRPKIGIALSGASGRAIAHIGVLEVLKENNIPIDFIVGCSSGSLIAVSFATDTMEELKEYFRSLNMSEIFKLWTTKDASGGLFQMHNADPVFNKFTKGKTFEEIEHPKLGFVAADITTGELINITHGEMLKAFKASVAVPGLFEPVVIDNRILVDGGLVNIVPTNATRKMGADIVIGVNIAATKFIYEKRLPIWRGYRRITRILGLQFFREKIWPKLSSRILFQFDSQSDVLQEENIKIPGVFSMLAKAIDHSLYISEQWTESEMACDLMLEPRVKHFGKTEFENLEKIYQEGRRAALQALPAIKKLIEDKSR